MRKCNLVYFTSLFLIELWPVKCLKSAQFLVEPIVPYESNMHNYRLSLMLLFSLFCVSAEVKK